MKVDTTLIDNGQFDHRLRLLIHKIRCGAIKARELEGNSADATWNDAFEQWDAVLNDLMTLKTEFVLNPAVEWAKRKTREFDWTRRAEGFCVGVAASVVAGFILWWLL
jgi:hypothetical protein